MYAVIIKFSWKKIKGDLSRDIPCSWIGSLHKVNVNSPKMISLQLSELLLQFLAKGFNRH